MPLTLKRRSNMGTTIQGSLKFNKRQLIALLGNNMYKNDVQEVAIKELVQNAFDAVKIAKAMGLISKAEISVDISSISRTIIVKDNGIGMSPEIVQKAFFTIGGSHKGDVSNALKSGGLGLAKMAFLFGSEWIDVTTSHDGTTTHVRATSEEILNDDFRLEVSHENVPNGTSITVKIPEYFINDQGERQSIYFRSFSNFLDKPLLGDITLTVNGKSEYKGKLPSEYISIGKAKADFGDIELYIAPGTNTNITTQVLISGLYQFNDTIWVDTTEKTFKCVMNILPSVGVQSRIYPINNQREGFRATIHSEVEDLHNLLKKIHAAYLRGQYAETFSSCMSMDVEALTTSKRVPYQGEILKDASKKVLKDILGEPFQSNPEVAMEFTLKMIHNTLQDKGGRIDASGVNIPNAGMVDISGYDINKPIFHNNTHMLLNPDEVDILKKFGSLMLTAKNIYVEAFGNFKRSTEYSWEEPVSIKEMMSKQFWGVSIDTKYVGINCSPTIFNFLAVNPFAFKIPEYPGIDPALFIMEYITHALIHEVNHNYARNEGSGFTACLVITEAEFASIGDVFDKWKQKLLELVKSNLDVFVEANKKYKNTTNKANSLS